MEHGKRFQTKHLNEHLHQAQEREDEEAIVKISAIIQQEKTTFILAMVEFCYGKDTH
jgi:hypothetical protein